MAAPAAAPASRIARQPGWFRFEDATADFPFYTGNPIRISPGGWWFVLGMVGVGFAALIAPIPYLSTPLGQFLPALLFCGIPLLALHVVVRGSWTALMRNVGARDVLLMFGFAALNIIVSLIVGAIVSQLYPVAANPIFPIASHLSQGELDLLLLKTIPQLFGEELLTILLFLAVLDVFHNRFSWSRRRAVAVATVVSCLVFGAVHLPTYNWHLLQCLVIIGTARLMLTLAYIKTKNIWVSTGAHIISDWSYLGMALLTTAR